jgi:hypothetical protein
VCCYFVAEIGVRGIRVRIPWMKGRKERKKKKEKSDKKK